MKWNILTHNIRGLNDPENIDKEKGFIKSISPRPDVIFLQEHKLRGRSLDNLGYRIMPGYASWVFEAAPGERNWANPDAAGKWGVRILLTHKYARLVTAHNFLYNNRVVWIKLEEIKMGKYWARMCLCAQYFHGK